VEVGISIAVISNQASHVAGRLRKPRDDRKLPIHATHAQKAADYISTDIVPPKIWRRPRIAQALSLWNLTEPKQPSASEKSAS
jgi:hypothetical protein